MGTLIFHSFSRRIPAKISVPTSVRPPGGAVRNTPCAIIVPTFVALGGANWALLSRLGGRRGEVEPNGARAPHPCHACGWPFAQPARAGRPPGWANSQRAQARWPDQLAGTLAKHAQFSQDWRCPFALRWLLGAFVPSATSYVLDARTTNPNKRPFKWAH